MSHDVAWTPIKVRGKRRGNPEEKLYNRKLRDPVLTSCRAVRRGSAIAFPVVGHPDPIRHLRHAETVDLGPLEVLPVELLHLIFECSSNLDLPLVSRTLAVAFANSQHLQLRLTNKLLQPVLGEGSDPTADELANAARLLDCRFMTWEKFAAWLLRQFNMISPAGNGIDDLEDLSRKWSTLRPCSRLLPPKKLLRPPFTTEKTKFLDLITRHVRDITELHPFHGEIARHGLLKAVGSGATNVASIFFRMGLQSDTELLRAAVETDGSDTKLVELVIEHAGDDGSLDLLDADLYKLIDRSGSSRATTLKQLIISAQRRRESADLDGNWS
jgi:hypothetical protein